MDQQFKKMAERLKKERVKRKSEEELLATKKECKRKYELSSHIIRISLRNFSRWKDAKNALNVKTNDEVASALLDLWEGMLTDVMKEADEIQKITKEAEPEQTLQKRSHLLGETTMAVHSTPVAAEKNIPTSVEFGGISNISESNGQSSDASVSSSLKDASLQKYIEKAKETDASFINITLELMPAEKDVSYHPTMSEEEEAYSEDSKTDEDVDYLLDMSLMDDNRVSDDVPVCAVADAILDVEDVEDDFVVQDEETDDDTEDTDTEERDIVTERKAICFEKNLMELASIHISSECNRKKCDKIVVLDTRMIGSCFRITWKCEKGHIIRRWNSQPLLKKKPAGDLLFSAALLCSGNNYEKVCLMHSFLRLGITASPTHYEIQSKHAIPVIKEEFERVLKANIEKYVGKNIVIAGGGRMDSPGHSAQYCTYTIMEYENKDILACEIVNKRETDMEKTAMEKEGLKRCLKKLSDSGITIQELCTDASTSIASMIGKEYPDIEHSFDIWDGAKNFGKRLGAVGAESKNKELRPWLPHVINHFWYCCREAGGDEDKLLGKWRGVLHHVVNDHEWAFGECDHGKLQETEDSKWLEPGESSHLALTKLVLDSRFLHNLRYYKNFRHTGDLESFHEHILMYCAKRFAYTHPVYKARNYLACIDYQAHKDRGLLRNKKGEIRLHRMYSKKSNNWTCYPQKQPKKYEYIPELLRQIIHHFVSSDIPLTAPQEMTPSDPRKMKRTLSELSPPPRVLMEQKKSRFGDEK